MNKAERQAEIERLEALRRKREGRPGFGENVEEIKAQIAELRRKLG